MPAALLAFVALSTPQSSVPSESRRHAIVDARIEVGDGTVIERGTVVMDGGRIVAVGPNLTVPAGTLIFTGTGLTVTPGFIDGWTTKGITLPPAAPEQDAPTGPAAPSIAEYAPAQMRDANRKGIRPELQARTLLSLNEDFSKPYRSAGFTTLHAIPGGGYLGGIGTVVNLSGRPNRDAIVIPRTFLLSDFEGPADGNGYPGSLLGRVAQVRQAWLDAQWQNQVRGAYQAGGAERPASDPTLEALNPFLEGKAPVGFVANSPSEIDRSLALAKEFNLRPVIIGGQQGYRRLRDLKEAGITVVASINFGEPPQTVAGEDSLRAAERKRKYDESVRNVIELRNAGIPVVLCTLGTKGPDDFNKQLRVLIAAGFRREDALRALTVDPANLVGAGSRMGSVKVGNIANLVVRDGDFTNEKTVVKMVYIDGYRLDPSTKPLPPGAKPAPVKDGAR